MFCPVCKAEYRQGFTHCADCDVDLVYALSDVEDLPEEPGAVWRSVWGGSDVRMCAELCAKLKDAEIPFKIIRREDRLFNTYNHPAQEIAVPTSFFDRTLELVGDPNEFMPADEPEAEAVLGLPVQDDSPVQAEREHNWDPGNWYPEDATVEVWSETGDHLTWMIESSLRENHIHSRTDILDHDSRRVFVTLEDENRAREIVREITQGVPPE